MYEARVITGATATGGGGGANSNQSSDIVKKSSLSNIDIPYNGGTIDSTNFGVVSGNNTLAHITNLENQLKWSVDQEGLPLKIKLIIYKTLLNKLSLYDETRKRKKGPIAGKTLKKNTAQITKPKINKKANSPAPPPPPPPPSPPTNGWDVLFKKKGSPSPVSKRTRGTKKKLKALNLHSLGKEGSFKNRKNSSF